MPWAKCVIVTRSLSGRFDLTLTLRERARVRTHLLTCAGCRAYEAQLAALHQLLHITAGHFDIDITPKDRQKIAGSRCPPHPASK